jgi:hypothetical protein
MPLNNGESSEGDGSNDFQEHRIRRSDEDVIDCRVGDVAQVDEAVGDLVGMGV